MDALRPCKLWVGKEWPKGVDERCGQDMEAWTGIQRFGRFDKDRLAWNGVWLFKAGGIGQEHLWVLFFCFQGHNGEDRLARRYGNRFW